MAGRRTVPIVVTAAAIAILAGCGPAGLTAGAGGTPPTTPTTTPTTGAPTTTAAPTPTVAPPPPTTTPPPATTTRPAPTHTTTPPPPTTTAPARAAGVPCSAAADACVSLSRQQAWLLRDGSVVYGPVPVATGRSGWRTPAGTFHVEWKARHWVSTVFHAPMPYSVFFYEGDAFHEGSVYERSHGCVHLEPSAAATFFDTLQVGDEVQVVW